MAVTKNRSSKTTKARSEKPKVDVEEIIISRLIAKFEKEGKMPWQKSYNPFSGQAPQNFMTGHTYSGINVLTLWGGSGRYITKTQLTEYNRKNGTSFWFPAGTPTETLVYYRESKAEISEAKANELIAQGYSRFVVKYGDKYYQIFKGAGYRDVYDCQNIVDKEGKPLFAPPRREPVQTTEVGKKAAKLAADYRVHTGVAMHTRLGTPCYRQTDDSISLPPRSDYRNEEVYYRDMFHELIHSTGVPQRLNRPEYNAYHQTRDQRSREEFVAEVGSMIIVAQLGFDYEGAEADNSENYVQGWCSWFKANPKEVFRGFTETQKAVEYLVTKAGGGSTEQPEVETATTAQPASALADQLPQTPKELAEYLTELSVKNNKRGHRTFKRIHDAGKWQGLSDMFGRNGEIVGELPIFIVELPNKTAVWVGMTFAIYVDANKLAKPLYSIERGNTLENAMALATKLHHEGLAQLVRYMDLRSKVK